MNRSHFDKKKAAMQRAVLSVYDRTVAFCESLLVHSTICNSSQIIFYFTTAGKITVYN